jgi:four helix bundle protein
MQNAKCKTGKWEMREEQNNRPRTMRTDAAKQSKSLKGDDLAERLLMLAVRAGRVADALPKTRLGRHVAGQLVRCGTSPAPNYEEARAAESRADFIHKLRICLKELRESLCQLQMAAKGELLSEAMLAPIVDESRQLCSIVGQSIVTARRSANGR